MSKEEIFDILCGKDKKDIYDKFQEIEVSITESNELYVYFDDILKLLENEKTSIRVRSFRLICQLAKWDKGNKINDNIDIILTELDDEKPTAVRQCLAALNYMLLFKVELVEKVRKKLVSIDITNYKDSMQPLIEKDIEGILKQYY